MALIEICCAACGLTHTRTVKQVNVVIKRSGEWKCQPCSLKARNSALAKKVGSTRVSPRGYVLEKTEKGWSLQHRLVMERHLGRKLAADELVHHINEVKTDNRIENLELTTWAEHTKEHHTGAKRIGVALENLREAYRNTRRK